MTIYRLDTIERPLFECNELFLAFVRDGMTREELQKNIDRRPQLWGRFAIWLDKLPTKGS